MSAGFPIPILMYHSVGRRIPGWKSPWFTLPARTFADHLDRLARAGYRSVTLDQVYSYVAGEAGLPRRSVALTFDDGYLDNWTYVVPLLKRYGFTGAVFVTPDFVDPRDVVRPTLDDVGFDEIDSGVLDVRGFMSWPELKRASDENVLSVQAHGLTHTMYPTGPEIVDFHRPGDSYLWLDWNAHLETKPFHIEQLGESRVKWGAPVYVHGKSLQVTRYFPDSREAERLISFVHENGGTSFFGRRDWNEILRAEVSRVRQHEGAGGRYETPDERRSRYEIEIGESGRRIEERIGRRADYFVFPGGGYNEESFELARSRYRAVAVAYPENERVTNRPGDDPGRISRRGTQLIVVGRCACYTGGGYLVEFLREYQGSRTARRRRQVMKLFSLAGLRVGFWR
jgi:peptidoglycan/xylan/chitin deacetylase (PgdA/CDA1 family)